MPYINTVRSGDNFYFENGESWEAASELHGDFVAAKPFPHIVLDGFLSEDFVDAINLNFPAREYSSVQRNHKHTRAKLGYRPDDLGTNLCRSYLSQFNSGPMLRFLEDLTGIKGLLPDPHFLGGGLHEISRGGKLDIHTDFNLHNGLRLVRRINLLLYLNEAWRPEYGGNLELWPPDLSGSEGSIEPIRNRCVIFQTDQSSFHGHPAPLTCPDHVTRRSIAVYYYTSPLESVAQNESLSSKTFFPSLQHAHDA